MAKRKRRSAKKRVRDYAKEYRQRQLKALREGRTIQEGRGRHPKEKKSKRFRPGRVTRKIRGPGPTTAPTYRSFTSPGAASAEVVFPLRTERQWARVRRYLRELAPSIIAERRLVFRFGGAIILGSGSPKADDDPNPGYGTTAYERYFDWELFMLAFEESRSRFVDGQIDDVHFAVFLG